MARETRLHEGRVGTGDALARETRSSAGEAPASPWTPLGAAAMAAPSSRHCAILWMLAAISSLVPVATFQPAEGVPARFGHTYAAARLDRVSPASVGLLGGTHLYLHGDHLDAWHHAVRVDLGFPVERSNLRNGTRSTEWRECIVDIRRSDPLDRFLVCVLPPAPTTVRARWFIGTRSVEMQLCLLSGALIRSRPRSVDRLFSCPGTRPPSSDFLPNASPACVRTLTHTSRTLPMQELHVTATVRLTSSSFNDTASSISCSHCKVQYRRDLTPICSTDRSNLRGAGGDTIAIVGTNWHLQDPDVTSVEQITVTIGRATTKVDGHSSLIRTLNSTSLVLHARIPRGLVAGYVRHVPNLPVCSCGIFTRYLSIAWKRMPEQGPADSLIFRIVFLRGKANVQRFHSPFSPR